MSWKTIAKTTQRTSGFTCLTEMEERIDKIIRLISKEDGRMPFLKSIVGQARKGKDLSERQMNYFLDIERETMAIEDSKTSPDFNRDLWEQSSEDRKSIDF